MRLILRLLPATAMLFPSVGFAQSVPAPLPSEIRLSDAERERVLEAAASSKLEQMTAQSEPMTASDGSARQVHGEVGFEIGTGGYRSAFGTAIIPIDNDAVAIISLGSTDFGSRGRYPHPWWQ